MTRRLRLFSTLIAAALALAAAGPARACVPVTVYFPWNSVELDQASRAALERFALSLAWKRPDLDHILLTAHTDTTGSPAANRAIALRRAEAVRDLLVRHDVPAHLIRIVAAAQERPRVRTGQGVREPRNRRVELLPQLSAEAQARQLESGAPIC